MAEKKDNFNLVIVIGFTLFLRVSSRNFMLKEMANEIDVSKLDIIEIVIAIGFFFVHLWNVFNLTNFWRKEPGSIIWKRIRKPGR